jgi:Glycosyl transferase family 2
MFPSGVSTFRHLITGVGVGVGGSMYNSAHVSRLRRLGRLVHYRVARLRPSRVTVIPPHGDAQPGPFDVGLVIATYNRPEYLRRTLDHLAHSSLDGTIVAIVDDASSSAETRQIVRECALGQTPIVKIFRTRRRGYAVHEALQDGWDLLANQYGCRLLANVDPDTIMKPDWLQRLVTVFRRERALQGPLILTAFHSRQHPTLSEADDVRVKSSIGGLNMMFDRELYSDLVRPNLVYEPMSEVGWDWYVVAAMRARGYPFLCLRPSLVQHIGEVGRFSRPDSHDVADDY